MTLRLTLATVFFVLVSSCGRNESSVANKEARALFDSLPASKASELFNKGLRSEKTGPSDSSIFFYQHALAIFRQLNDTANVIVTNLSIANLYLNDFKYEFADRHLEDARILVERSESSDDIQVGVYTRLSQTKMELKDYPTAISLSNKVIAILLAQRDPDKRQLALLYKRLGNIHYYARENELAESYLRKGIGITDANDHQHLGRLYSDLALLYIQIGRYQSAMECFDISISHDLQWAGPDSDPIAKRYLQKAKVYEYLGLIDSALWLLQENLRIRTAVYGEKDRNTFGANYTLGQFFFNRGDYASGLRYFQSSLISLVDNFNESNWNRNPEPASEDMNVDIILGLVGKGNCLSRLGGADTAQIQPLASALSAYSLADSVLSVFRRNFATDDPQLAQLNQNYIPYEQMLNICFSLYAATNELTYLKNAFEIMEKSRGLLLQASLSKAASVNRAGLPQELLRREKALIVERQTILQMLERNQDRQARDSLYEMLLETNGRHQSLLRDMEAVAPRYTSFKYGDERVDFEALRGALDDQDAQLIEIFWGNENIYVVGYDGETFRKKEIARSPQLQEAFSRVSQTAFSSAHDLIDKKKFNQFCQDAPWLYEQFFDGVISDNNDLTKVIISADGALAAFPFEMLLTAYVSPKQIDYRLPYMVREYSISYLFSTRVWLHSLGKDRNGAKFLAMGYAGTSQGEPGRNEYSGLPGTEREVSMLKDRVGGSENTFLLGGEVTESKFKALAPAYNTIHLAIHGTSDTARTFESRLIFRNDEDGTDDGMLYSHEVYNIDLEALDLAVLSACESGIGKLHSSEGMMSMARGFAYAGCPSMIISLWKVDDNVAVELMRTFYQNLLAGRDLDVSVKLAKTDYLRAADEVSSHPKFWAAFVQIGSNSNVKLTRSPVSLYVLFAVAVMAAAMLFIIKRRKIARQEKIPA